MSRRRLLTIPILIAALSLLVVGGVRAGGSCASEHMSDERGTTVRMTEGCFEPTVIRVKAGDTVTWVNTASVPHNAVGAARSWFAGEVEKPGDRISHRFDEPGVFPYFCHMHMGMVGAVVVEPAEAQGVVTPGGAGGSDAAIAPAASNPSPTAVATAVPADASGPAASPASTPAVPVAAGALAVAAASLILLAVRRRIRRTPAEPVPAP
jgi:plastocyanin